MALNLTAGNRRARTRGNKDLGECFFSLEQASEKTIPVKIESVSFGITHLSFEASHSDLIHSFGSSLNIQVRQKDELFINGDWLVENISTRDNRIYLRLSHKLLGLLKEFEEYILPENLLLTNRHKLISNDAEDFSRHLAEIKDCPVSVYLNISPISKNFTDSRKESLGGKFDFSSGSKELSSLDFSVNLESINFEENQKIKIDYEFLGARFTFVTTITTIDADFGIISAAIPSAILSLTTRSFDRTDTDFDVQVSSAGDDNFKKCKIKSISAKGAELHFTDEPLKEQPFTVGSKLKLVAEENLSIVATTTNIRKNIIGISFNNDEKTISVKRALFKKASINYFKVRDSESYPDFLKLYEDVGYGVTDEESKATWERQSQAVWAKQDHILPGNTAGFEREGSLLGCASALPMSKNTIVIHSVGVVKDAQALPKTLDLLNYCHSWLEMISGIKTLCMCFRHRSRFMTRLHISAETHASPESTQILPCIGYLGSPKVTAEIKVSFQEFSLDTPIEINPDFRRIYEAFNEVHAELREMQSIRLYRVFLNQNTKPSALIIHHTAEPLFTAVDTFRTAFCFILDKTENLQTIVDAAGSYSPFSGHEICTFIEDAKTHQEFHYSGSMEATPLFLYLLAKSDFGPLLASMHRFIYKTLRKYGEESLDYLQKVVSA